MRMFAISFDTSITISPKLVPAGPVDTKSALVQVMAWQQTGNKPSPTQIMIKFYDATWYH